MTAKLLFLSFALAIAGAHAFSNPRKVRFSSVSMMAGSPFANFPNPFSSKTVSSPAPAGPWSSAFDPSPDGLIARAKIVLAADLGVQDGSLLAEKFIWIGPQLGSQVLGKSDYLAAGKYFDLRAAFPDLDYRAHDFRIAVEDPMTVRLTARTVGTMRGELRLRGESLDPNGKTMLCPPEAISMTFANNGEVTKICSGFTMDRLVGNTVGLCGVMAAATVAGAPPTDWEVYPATTVLNRFFARPVQQLTDVGSFLAPFPETVMIQLSKGILAADMATKDPNLLAAEFTYCGAYVGPVDKRTFLKEYASLLFGGVDPQLTHFRVDPYDPYRVWVDVRSVGEINGAKIDAAPQAMSFTFDDNGFCTRLTAGAVMDPSVGNSGGLGGVEGTKYAMGTPEPGIASRPLPQNLARLRKRLLEPISKIGVDDYVLAAPTMGTPKAKVSKPSVPSTDNQPPLAKINIPTTTVPPASPVTKISALVKKVAPPARLKVNQAAVKESAQQQAANAQAKKQGVAEAKKAEQAAVAKRKAEEADKKRAMDLERSKLKSEVDAAARRAVEAKKAASMEAAKRNAEKVAAKKQAEAAKAVEEKAKRDVEKANTMAQKERVSDKVPEYKTSKTLKIPQAKVVNPKLAATAQRSAVAQIFFSTAPKSDAVPRTAPRGIPTLNKWKKSGDGCIIGLITGSSTFGDNEKITTSVIAKGTIASGEVVTTQSGSKYFLS